MCTAVLAGAFVRDITLRGINLRRLCNFLLFKWKSLRLMTFMSLNKIRCMRIRAEHSNIFLHSAYIKKTKRSKQWWCYWNKECNKTRDILLSKKEKSDYKCINVRLHVLLRRSRCQEEHSLHATNSGNETDTESRLCLVFYCFFPIFQAVGLIQSPIP
jgi:hypothetical protein